MGGSQTVGRWLGGYKRAGKRGPTFIIERWIDGHRYHVSTKCRTERAALEQLAVFEADPQHYKPNRSRLAPVQRRGVTVTPDLILEYTDWMATREEPATAEHIHKHTACLEDWMRFYKRRPIAEVPLREIAEALTVDAKGRPVRNRAMRIQALKSFCEWLRKSKFLLDRPHDPTIDLNAPPRRAAKDVRQVAIEPERILKALPFLPDSSRDLMILRLGTGWHSIEVRRFAVNGEIRHTPGKFVHLMTAEGPVKVPLLATLAVKQKIGVQTNTPIIYAEHLAAAERIQASGYVPSQSTMGRHLRAACKKAGVPYFWNWHIRHSVVSNAIESGADPEQAGPFVDHLNVDTTRRHYTQIALPKKTVPVLRVIDGAKAG